MRKLNYVLFILFVLLSTQSAYAILSMSLTHGVAGAIPIAVVPFAAGKFDLPQDIGAIIGNDLQTSGRFKVFGRAALSQFPSLPQAVSNAYFRRLGTDHVVIGNVNLLKNEQYQVSFQLLDTLHDQGTATLVLNETYVISKGDLRRIAHHISDLVFNKLTGIRGVFSTRLAYIVVQRNARAPTRYVLEVSDQDGYNPRPLLVSEEPIMSPAWSPDGKVIAYVSFENQRAAIYLEEISTGKRTLLSVFPGINGAPAWSPDGRKMALVLSKSGSPNIYVMDMASKQLKQITNDSAINTEPAWSHDGKSLLFTSNRTGNPQIYQADLASGAITRISYAGDYNARASFTRDGKYIAMIHRVGGIYNIGLLSLDTGTTKVLTTATTGDSASPSIAPNGSMILYDTVYHGINMLGMVSADGRIQLVLPARNGEAQDPAWSPYVS